MMPAPLLTTLTPSCWSCEGSSSRKKASNRDDYDSIADEIFQLRELKAKSETDSVVRDERLAQITELCDFLKAQPSEITTFDESLVRRLLQKITVFEYHFTVEFKHGIKVDIEG